MIPMRDGVTLEAWITKPSQLQKPLPTVFTLTQYDIDGGRHGDSAIKESLGFKLPVDAAQRQHIGHARSVESVGKQGEDLAEPCRGWKDDERRVLAPGYLANRVRRYFGKFHAFTDHGQYRVGVGLDVRRPRSAQQKHDNALGRLPDQFGQGRGVQAGLHYDQRGHDSTPSASSRLTRSATMASASPSSISLLRACVAGRTPSVRTASASGTSVASIGPLLKGPTLIAYSHDPVAAPKVAAAFAKDHEKFVILGGAMGVTALNPDGVKSLATMPSLDELRAKLVGLVQAPATKLAQLSTAPAAKLARVFGAYAERDAA